MNRAIVITGSTHGIGAMYGARVALAGMLDQGFGSLYNMEGLGSDGRRVEERASIFEVGRIARANCHFAQQ